jgi:hypothetical protein
LSFEKEAICQERGFPVLRKPFLLNEILHLIGYRFLSFASASAK